jgi:survival of motor neuron protein-interacting protein 1
LETIQNQQNNGRIERKQPVPPMKDRPGWHIFCVGQKEARGNLGGYFAEDEDSEEEKEEELEDSNDGQMEESENLYVEENEQSTHNAEEKENGTAEPNKQSTESDWQKELPEDGMFPSVSLVLQLDQVMLRRVISHLSYYVQEGWYPCSPQRTRWLYSLLARMEKPIHRNDAAVLYSLLKALTRARATLPKLIETDREGLARLNTLIAIVGVYFEQGGGLCF